MAVVAMGRASGCRDRGERLHHSMRALPLQNGAQAPGVILLRDVSEARRHEQELMTKDADDPRFTTAPGNNQCDRVSLGAEQTAVAVARKRRPSRWHSRRPSARPGRPRPCTPCCSQNVDESVDFDARSPGNGSRRWAGA